MLRKTCARFECLLERELCMSVLTLLKQLLDAEAGHHCLQACGPVSS